MDFKKAQNYWKEKDASNKNMPSGELKKEIDSFSSSHNTLALATGYGDYVRCTPVEYTYYKDSYWIMSEGGDKFIGLEKNRNVCIAIFDSYEGFGKIKGMQVEGTAEFIEPFSEEYNAFLALKKIPVEAIKKLPEPMPMIRIVPRETDLLESSLKEKGYSSRQHYTY